MAGVAVLAAAPAVATPSAGSPPLAWPQVMAGRLAAAVAAAAGDTSQPGAGPARGTRPAPGAGPAPGAAVLAESAGHAVAARAYWTGRRLARAVPWLAAPARARARGPRPGRPRAGRPPAAAMRVGALFSHDPSGDHFCTASVVHSPGRDMLITAAHCVHGGRGRTYRRDIVFVPGYRHGTAPFGVWVPARMIVAGAWARSSDPALDVAFIVLRPVGRERIEDLLGADRLGIDQGFRNLVRVTGYPGNGSEPITCVNRTARQGRDQMRFACRGYLPGTSGSPWLMRRRRGTWLVIGVIGGYQDGGDTPDVSYSPYFGARVRRLYLAAVARS